MSSVDWPVEEGGISLTLAEESVFLIIGAECDFSGVLREWSLLGSVDGWVDVNKCTLHQDYYTLIMT